MQSKLMNKYFKNSSNKIESVNEGIGVAAARLAPSTGLVFLIALVTGAVSWGFVIMYWLTKSMAQHAVFSLSVQRIIEFLCDPQVRSYIEKASVKAYNKTKKDYPGLVETISTKDEEIYKQRVAACRSAGSMTALGNLLVLNSQIDSIRYKHTVAIFGDTTHIEQIYVIFLIKATKEYICVPLPPPSKEELKNLFG